MQLTSRLTMTGCMDSFFLTLPVYDILRYIGRHFLFDTGLVYTVVMLPMLLLVIWTLDLPICFTCPNQCFCIFCTHVYIWFNSHLMSLSLFLCLLFMPVSFSLPFYFCCTYSVCLLFSGYNILLRIGIPIKREL